MTVYSKGNMQQNNKEDELRERRMKLFSSGKIWDSPVDLERYGKNFLDSFGSWKNFFMEAIAHFEYTDIYPVTAKIFFQKTTDNTTLVMVELWNKGLDDNDQKAFKTLELTGSGSKDTWNGKGIGLRSSGLGNSVDKAIRLVSMHNGKRFEFTHLVIPIEFDRMKLEQSDKLEETANFPPSWFNLDHEGVKYILEMSLSDEQISELSLLLSWLFAPYLRNGKLEIEIQNDGLLSQKVSAPDMAVFEDFDIITQIDAQNNVVAGEYLPTFPIEDYVTHITTLRLKEGKTKDFEECNKAIQDIADKDRVITNGSFTMYHNSVFTFTGRPFHGTKPEDWVYFEFMASWQKDSRHDFLTKTKRLKITPLVKDILDNVFEKLKEKYTFLSNKGQTSRKDVIGQIKDALVKIALGKKIEDEAFSVKGEVKPDQKPENKGEGEGSPTSEGEKTGTDINPSPDPKHRNSPKNLFYCKDCDIYDWKRKRTRKIGKDLSKDKTEMIRAIRIAKDIAKERKLRITVEVKKIRPKIPKDKIKEKIDEMIEKEGEILECPKCHKDMVYVKRYEWLGVGVRTQLERLGIDVQPDPDAKQTFRSEYPTLWFGVNLPFAQKLEDATATASGTAITAFISELFGNWGNQAEREDTSGAVVDLNRRLWRLEQDYLLRKDLFPDTTKSQQTTQTTLPTP